MSARVSASASTGRYSLSVPSTSQLLHPVPPSRPSTQREEAERGTGGVGDGGGKGRDRGRGREGRGREGKG